MDYGDLRAIEALLPKTNITQDDYDQRIREIVSIRDARHHISESALHSARLGNLILAPVNRELYHPFKVFFYLVNERTKYDDGACRIWHLGACHPALAREMRPILVNFDPDCVMIDSDPQALDHLQASYANNRNARFLPASIEDAQSLAPNNPPEALVFSTPDKNLELLSAFMMVETKPRIIILSQDGISSEDWANLYARLPLYRVIYFDGFACAYRKDWFLYYSSFLFIDHGITGIFAPLAEKIFATARPENRERNENNVGSAHTRQGSEPWMAGRLRGWQLHRNSDVLFLKKNGPLYEQPLRHNGNASYKTTMKTPWQLQKQIPTLG